MYSLATILLIGFAAALPLEKIATVDMAQVNATHTTSDCKNSCQVPFAADKIDCKGNSSLQTYCDAHCGIVDTDWEAWIEC